MESNFIARLHIALVITGVTRRVDVIDLSLLEQR
jgi:hypothetical protein